MIPGYKTGKVTFFPKSDRIVHHKQHSYDDHGRVIVVDIEDEDRQEFINSFAESCGLKNILRQLQLTGQPIPASMMYDPSVDAVEEVNMPDNVSDLKKAAESGDQVIRDAVKQFNEQFGTNYTPEQYIKMMSDGTLLETVQTFLKEKEKSEAAASEEGK